MRLHYAFCLGSMETCSAQQEIFDDIKDLESDDELPIEIKVSEHAQGKAPTRRRKLIEIEKMV